MSKSLHNIPLNDTIREYIRTSCWDAKESGWRPFANEKEASLALGLVLRFRGNSWRMMLTKLFPTHATTFSWLGIGSDTTAITDAETYSELFNCCKTYIGDYPVGVPIDFDIEEFLKDS